MIAINASDYLSAWMDASSHLLMHGPVNNLLVEFDIKSEDFESNNYYDYNPYNLDRNLDNISDVINTIFPQKLYVKYKSNINYLYNKYIQLHNRRFKRKNAWGTYFLRLIDSPLINKGKDKNQLEAAILKIIEWEKNYKAVFNFHITEYSLERWRPLGSPCLQYIQINCVDGDSISLTAVYRSHDYLNKALGNYVGLLYLLNYICERTGRKPNSICCLSIHAYPENKKLLRKLVDGEARVVQPFKG